MSVPFDARRAQLAGPPAAMIEGVMQSINMPNVGAETGMGQFAISAVGNLVYANGGVAPLSVSTLVRKDRKGVETEVDAPKGKAYFGPRLSPDGSRVALIVANGITSQDIWVIDVKVGTATRLTSHGVNQWPLWSPDEKKILFSGGAGSTQLLSAPADGSGIAELVMSAQTLLAPTSWPMERLPLVYVTGSDHSEIWSRPMSGGGQPKRFCKRDLVWRMATFLLTDAGWLTVRMNPVRRRSMCRHFRDRVKNTGSPPREGSIPTGRATETSCSIWSLGERETSP